ncbi:MAG: hypothetical protein P1R58_10800 [bacterium]|nr:hypothetical protein [bacterium]
MYRILLIAVITGLIATGAVFSQDESSSSLYEVPPLWLVDVPTAGTLPRGHYQIGTRIFPGGGAIGFTDIGLSNRLQLGVSYGAYQLISNDHPDWNPRIEFEIRFRIIDEMEMFPAVCLGFSSQGSGRWNTDLQRYTFKSRGFFGTVSRSFYFYEWTAGWHGGVNYSLENDVDGEKDLNVFAGFDATFKYNLALMLEYDAGINDDRSNPPDGVEQMAGKGRGYLNSSINWLFADNLELEFILKDLLINRRESATITREIRITYQDKF